MTCRLNVLGCGRTQISRANAKQKTTAICLLEATFLIFAGMKDQREGAGGAQNIDDDERELAEEEAEELRLDGSSNFEMVMVDDVARSFGDLSRNGSLVGVLKTLQRLSPISATVAMAWCREKLQVEGVVRRLRQGDGSDGSSSFT